MARRNGRLRPGIVALVLATGLVAGWSGGARGQADSLGITEADWPCHGRYRLEFTAGAYWQGPTLDQASAAWREDTPLRKLAEELAASDTMERAAKRLIADFGAALPRDDGRPARLTRLFHGVLDEINLYRRFVLEGIVGFVGRHRLAAGVLAETEAELQAVADDGATPTAEKRKSLEERRFWQARAVEDAMDEARFLCTRLNSLDAKLGMLARAITEQLEP